MTVSLVEKARRNRLVALRAIQIRKSGSDRVTLFPRADDNADRIMFTSRRAQNKVHNLFAVA
ncbi:hypothetical protein [Litoreibacter arenae]|uniref:Uncharacterized protein n=1 Tax=Litoreibacter arenae DSM 19593 TaxID=1123360 RepID=S9S680_9RHOB|nr:hypothetical protein [Litoreibacter arenae]EPX81724.1 hypothetical protein thalar_00281 [Litoreibacter arenae DSM 19593]